MGLLDGTQQNYYQNKDHGNYQFTSLDDIITQFQIAYVGENKIIPKIKRADIAFHAQRAMQELSFDTFESIKAYEITLSPSLIMPLPHDYVNYTKLSTVDSSGIKHLLYPTNSTSNPFNIKQLEDGVYSFLDGENLVVNYNFSSPLEAPWNYTLGGLSASSAWGNTSTDPEAFIAPNGLKEQIKWKYDSVGIVDGKLTFKSHWNATRGVGGWGRKYGAWQEIDTSLLNFIDLSATGVSAEAITDNVDTACDAGILRIGLSSVNPNTIFHSDLSNIATNSFVTTPGGLGLDYGSMPSIHEKVNLDLGYVEWDDGTTSTQTLLDVDVSQYDKVWVWVQSHAPWKKYAWTKFVYDGGEQTVAGATDNSTTVVLDSITATNTREIITGMVISEVDGVAWSEHKVEPGASPKIISIDGTTLTLDSAQSFSDDSTLTFQITQHLANVPTFNTSYLPGPNYATFQDPSTNTIDNISVTSTSTPNALRERYNGSIAWENYKSTTPSENNTDDYTDSTYWPAGGERFGLNPSHAQINGSFYIDQRLGKIHFSSNISGKTVILDYISDSLGTDAEMQVHKFAEEAMYKWIAYAILSTSSNQIHQQLVPRFKKEKFAETRKAKLRLSNIKLEELTRILRGKSKHIKH